MKFAWETNIFFIYIHPINNSLTFNIEIKPIQDCYILNNTTTVDDFFDSIQWYESLQNWTGQVRSDFFIQKQPEYKYTCGK